MKTYQWAPIDEKIPKNGTNILVAGSKSFAKVFWGDVHEGTGWKPKFGWCIDLTYNYRLGGYKEFENPEFYMKVSCP